MFGWIVSGWFAAAVVVWMVLLRPFFRSVSQADEAMIRVSRETRLHLHALPAPATVEPETTAGQSVSGYDGLVLDRLCRHARRVTGAELSTLVVRDGRTPEGLIVAAADGAAELVGDRLPAGFGLAGQAIGSAGRSWRPAGPPRRQSPRAER